MSWHSFKKYIVQTPLPKIIQSQFPSRNLPHASADALRYRAKRKTSYTLIMSQFIQEYFVPRRSLHFMIPFENSSIAEIKRLASIKYCLCFRYEWTSLFNVFTCFLFRKESLPLFLPCFSCRLLGVVSLIRQSLKVDHMAVKYIFMSNLYTVFAWYFTAGSYHGTRTDGFYLYFYQHAITWEIRSRTSWC